MRRIARAPASSAPPATGRLPPEVIQAVVRERFRGYRTCYEQGLRRDVTLEGRVTVRFDIERDGKVARASTKSFDIPDVRVRACVRKAFEGLVFPPPADGIVTVTYPIMFSLPK